MLLGPCGCAIIPWGRFYWSFLVIAAAAAITTIRPITKITHARQSSQTFSTLHPQSNHAVNKITDITFCTLSSPSFCSIRNSPAATARACRLSHRMTCPPPASFSSCPGPSPSTECCSCDCLSFRHPSTCESFRRWLTWSCQNNHRFRHKSGRHYTFR